MSLLVRDVEDLLNMFRNILIADFNDCIDAMNLRKGDTLLEHFEDDSYLFFLRSKPNKKRYIHLWAARGDSNSNSTSNLTVYDVSIEVVIQDDLVSTPGQGSFIKSIRYVKALENTIIKNAEIHQSNIEIETVLPFNIEDKKSIQRDVKSGIIISTTLS